MAGTRKRKAVHDDDSKPNTETKKPTRKRKRQGVTKTNSAAVKALIRQNQANSPLLRLAPEIREKILTYLVGNEVLHLYHSDEEQLDIDTSSEREAKEVDSGPARIIYLSCQSNTSEAADYHRDHRHEDNNSADRSGHYFPHRSQQRHKFCNYAVTVKEKRQKFNVCLNILGVSRQCYEEANYLLWSTNTFTFNDPEAFNLFFSSLNLAQKRNLKSLSFFASIDPYSLPFEFEWQQAFRPGNLSMLQGLRKLAFSFDLHQNMNIAAPYCTMGSQIMDEMESFLRFRMIPLKQVTVWVSDDPWLDEELKDDGTRLTAPSKVEFARELEIKLLDADPAATIEAEEDANELVAFEAVRVFWNDTVEHLDDDLGACRADFDSATAHFEAAEVQLPNLPPSIRERVRCEIDRLRGTLDEAGIVLDGTMKLVGELKASMHNVEKAETSKRQKEREIRKRQWASFKPRVVARTKPVSS